MKYSLYEVQKQIEENNKILKIILFNNLIIELKALIVLLF